VAKQARHSSLPVKVTEHLKPEQQTIIGATVEQLSSFPLQEVGCWLAGVVLGSELGLQDLLDFAFAPRQSSSSLDFDTALLPLLAELGFLLPLARAAAVTAWFAVLLYSNTLAFV
jgi:hypothetical protein